MTLDVFGVNIVDIDLNATLDAGVNQRFVERLVGIQQLHVLTDHGDTD